MSTFFPKSCVVTPDMLARAEASALNIGHLNNSILGGDGNVVGCLGELGLIYLFPGAVSNNTYQHDTLYKGFTIECKTKNRKVPPFPSYEASVSAYNTSQNADYYAFLSVRHREEDGKFLRVYFCGFMSKEEYFKDNPIREQGTVDPSNGFDTPAACYNRYYWELHKTI